MSGPSCRPTMSLVDCTLRGQGPLDHRFLCVLCASVVKTSFPKAGAPRDSAPASSIDYRSKAPMSGFESRTLPHSSTDGLQVGSAALTSGEPDAGVKSLGAFWNIGSVIFEWLSRPVELCQDARFIEPDHCPPDGSKQTL